jgi:hypothetical protein
MAQEEQGNEAWASSLGSVLDFKAIAASVVQACIRSSEAQLAGNVLIELSFLARTVSGCNNPQCNELKKRLQEIQEESLQYLGRELARSRLITAIGVLDFCLFELLAFMISIRPNLLDIPNALSGLPKRKAEEETLAYAKKILRHTSIERRLDLARDLLGVAFPQTLRDELDPLLTKRHDITHHSKYYEAVLSSSNTVRMEARAFPEVSFDEAMIASMNSTELCDVALISVAQNFFNIELGDLRPLNPALARVHQDMRRKISENRAQEPVIEDIADAGWEATIFNNTFVSVMDRAKSLSIAATGIEDFPMLLGCFRHKAHGKKAYLKIDTHEREEFGIKKPTFPLQLLRGESLLVEYSTEFSDFPLFMRLSLAGFAEAWNKAVEIKRTAATPKS